MAMTQQEAVAELTKANESMVNAGNDIDNLLAEIERLKAQIESGEVTPELEAAVRATVERAAALDALVQTPQPEK